MKFFSRIAIVLLAAIGLPLYSLAGPGGGIHVSATIFSFLNIVLLITSVISIKQFFFDKNDNHTPFHIINIIFAILFYILSLSYLISNKAYYEDYSQLMPLECIQQFFFSISLYSAMQWVIMVAFLVNIIYIIKNIKEYRQGTY